MLPKGLPVDAISRVQRVGLPHLVRFVLTMKLTKRFGERLQERCCAVSKCASSPVTVAFAVLGGLCSHIDDEKVKSCLSRARK